MGLAAADVAKKLAQSIAAVGAYQLHLQIVTLVDAGRGALFDDCTCAREGLSGLMYGGGGFWGDRGDAVRCEKSDSQFARVGSAEFNSARRLESLPHIPFNFVGHFDHGVILTVGAG